MNTNNDVSGNFALDMKQLRDLKTQAATGGGDSLKGVAHQFEAQFMQMMLKSMRDATPQDGMFDSEQSKLYTSMLDQQLSQNMSRGIGLADLLVKQLSRNQPATGTPAAGPEADAGAVEAPQAAPSSRRAAEVQRPQAQALTAAEAAGAKAMSAAAVPTARPGSPVTEFTRKVMAHAEEASRDTGIPARFMVGQAALESGWGRREIRSRDGAPSHNLFGIKAGPGWTGATVAATTTEYVNGVPHRTVQKFRAYDNYADAFRDYAKLLKDNPRYQNVLANGQDAVSFARGLQKAGYATDPQYANKLARILTRTLTA